MDEGNLLNLVKGMLVLIINIFDKLFWISLNLLKEVGGDLLMVANELWSYYGLKMIFGAKEIYKILHLFVKLLTLNISIISRWYLSY